MENITIRLFSSEDTSSVVNLIHRNLFEVNIKDYKLSTINRLVNDYNADKINCIASNAHLYVACINNKIVGSGAVMQKNHEESLLLTIFTLPERQGYGVGRKIVDTLESDPYFLQAKKAILYSSISACEFYLKLGYCYENGCAQLNDNEVYLLTKNVSS